MAALRWILLLAGLVFLAGLASWEMRRSRHARRELSDASQGGSGAARGEPELGQLPEELAGRSHLSGTGFGADGGRLIGAMPPVVQLPPDSDAADADVAGADVAAVAAATDAAADAAATDAAATGAAAAPAGPVDIPPLGELDEALIATDVGVAASLAGDPSLMDGTALDEPAPAQGEPTLPAPGPLPEAAVQPAQPAPLRVDWPPDGERQIIALRLVAASEQRLSGRSTRQALAACGFVHGRYGIFHQPGADGRALLSCASLSKPGIFDPAAMDFQRFSGLSVFAVLPGPLPAAEALDQLLATGAELSQRLQALLQDEQGRALDEPRIAQLRDSVRPLPAAATGEQPAEPTA
jgi:hypothetical protein